MINLGFIIVQFSYNKYYDVCNMKTILLKNRVIRPTGADVPDRLAMVIEDMLGVVLDTALQETRGWGRSPKKLKSVSMRLAMVLREEINAAFDDAESD